MAKETSKRTTSASRAAGIQAALDKIAASGLMQKLAEEKSEGAYDAEKAMEHGNFARPHFRKDSESFKVVTDKKAQPYIYLGSVDTKASVNSRLQMHMAEMRSFNESILKSAVSQQGRLSARQLYYLRMLNSGLESNVEVEVSDGLSVLVTHVNEDELPLPRYVSFDESDEFADYLEMYGSVDIVFANDNDYVVDEDHASSRRRKS